MKVVISGGGTGGHIYPALAIINEMKRHHQDAKFLYMGTKNGLEANIVGKTDIPFETVEISGFKRKISMHNLKTVWKFPRAVSVSKRKIRSFAPDVVIGTGGYVCGPVVYAASRLGIPTLIHEQNVVPGLTNKFLSRYVDAVAVSFEGSTQAFQHDRVIVTGNPRATEVVRADAQKGRESLRVPQGRKIVLIVGGSRGAQAINEAFIGMADRLQTLTDYHFVYVTGEIHYEDIMSRLMEKKVPFQRLSIKPFVYNMPDVLAATSLIINRAGASFLSEITALGLPSILVPSPHVTNNHQEKNARWLEQQGASVLIKEEALNSDQLWTQLTALLQDDARLSQMRKNAAKLGKPEAAQDVYHVVESLLQA